MVENIVPEKDVKLSISIFYPELIKSDMALDQYVESMIYKPLGLNNTMFNPSSKGIDSAKVIAGPKDYTSENLNGVSGISGLYSTVKDMEVLSQLILNYGGYGSVKIIDKNQIQLI